MPVAAANLPDEQRENLPEQRSGGSLGSAARVLGALPSQLQDRLLTGDSLVLPTSALTPAVREHLDAMVIGLNKTRSRFNLPPIDLDDGERWRVRIARSPEQLPGTIVYFVTLSSPKNRGTGTAVNITVPDLFADDPRGFRLARTTRDGAESPVAQPAPKSMAPRGGTWDQVLAELARRLDRSVVSDAYVGDVMSTTHPGPAREGETIEQYLDRACRTWPRRWGQSILRAAAGLSD